jgi:hypothetical protein
MSEFSMMIPLFLLLYVYDVDSFSLILFLFFHPSH